MLNRQKKIALGLLPSLLLSLVPIPSGHATPWLRGKAVIKSCANPEPRHRPYYGPKGGPKLKSPLGYGTTGGAPAPTSMMQPPPVQAETEARRTIPSKSRKPEPKKSRDEGQLDLHQAGKKVDKNIRRASELYLSNDDSMSLASAQRIIYSINNFLPMYRNEIRPHEFLNYFHFKTNPVASGETFSVNFQMAPREQGETLALAVQGKKISKEERRPAVITFILDKSGSMRSQGKMEYLKEGMETLKKQLKEGDVLNVVEFDHEVCNAIEGFVVGRDPWPGYDKTVEELGPRGSTNLHDGLVEGYKLAEKFYSPGKVNRVILITDAIANTGTLSPELMASIGKYYDTQKIALSGIGVGLDFNDELLDTLTDKGKGAYLFLGIKESIPRVFGTDFISLLETVARNVHFKATFPKGLNLDIFYGEEVSTEKSKVQPIHYFANSSQLFLLDLKGKATEANPTFKLQIEFTKPQNSQAKVETLSMNVEQIQADGRDNVIKARLIMALANLLEKTALPGTRPYHSWYRKPGPEVGDKKEGKKLCAKTLEEMQKYQAQYSDQETQYALGLANKYCSRF